MKKRLKEAEGRNEEKDTSNGHNEIVISLDLGLFPPKHSCGVCVCVFFPHFPRNYEQQ